MEQYYTNSNSGLHYDLKLNLEPRHQKLSVSGNLAYHSPDNRIERARFYLHHQFNIQQMEGTRVLGYSFNPAAELPVAVSPQAGILDIYFSPPLRKDETALIQFAFEGKLTVWPTESPCMVSRDWSELNKFMPWYPCQINGSSADLTFTIKIFTPEGYQAASIGRSEVMNNAFYFSWPHPTNDIPVMVGKNLTNQVFESDSNRVNLSWTTLSQTVAARLGEDTLWMLERYAGWFGPTRPNEITLIQSPRVLGGGYSRRGIVVLDSLDEQEFLTRPDMILGLVGRTAARTWWWDAPNTTWEDWLNESFAEYSVMMALRERLGQDTFDQILGLKRKRAFHIPPLWKFDRNDVSTPQEQEFVERMLLDKGPLLLHQLSERIGRQRFLELCRARIWSGVTQTEHLLDLLAELEGRSSRDWFEETLKS